MEQKDLDAINHIIFFSQEELDKGYHYCNDIFNHIKQTFPNHRFLGMPDTITIKELDKEKIVEVIEGLQQFIKDNFSNEEEGNE